MPARQRRRRGHQADLKTFSALLTPTAITAITAQNTCGVTGIHGVPPDMLKAQIDAVVQDIGVDAVKIGMLHSPDVVRVVAMPFCAYQLPHVVLGPVMVGHQWRPTDCAGDRGRAGGVSCSRWPR